MSLSFRIKAGLIVRQDSSVIEGKDLYQFLTTKESRSLLTGDIKALLPSKRPVVPSYEVTVINRRIRFKPFCLGVILSPDELASADLAGYFIRLERIYFLTDESRKELQSTIRCLSLPDALAIIRKLRLEGRLLSEPSDLIQGLCARERLHFTISALFVKELYPYQLDGVDWLCFCVRHGLGSILADDMGLGKTAQIIATVCDTIEQEPESIILIVVPNPLIDNWQREFTFFAPMITPYVHYGSNRSGLASDLNVHHVIITTYTTLVSDITMLTEINFRLALYDEASMLKNAKSGRSVAASVITAKVKIAITGTPVENSLADVWALSELVFPGYLDTFENFSHQYIGKNIEGTLARDLGELENSLRQITLRRMKKDVLKQIPEKRDIHFAVTMQEKERAAYDTIIAEMQADADSNSTNILALINKLQQFTSHPALLDQRIDNSLRALSAASGKFELLIGLLDKIHDSGEKVLIFATYQKMIDLIILIAEKRYAFDVGRIDGRTPNDERQPLIDQFSETKGFSILVLHPKTAGMGFNITAATHVIHYSRQWNPALEMQATARAWRNGQTNPVNAYYFYYANTIEESVDERLRQKQALSDSVVSVVDNKESDKQLMLNYLENKIR